MGWGPFSSPKLSNIQTLELEGRYPYSKFICWNSLTSLTSLKIKNGDLNSEKDFFRKGDFGYINLTNLTSIHIENCFIGPNQVLNLLKTSQNVLRNFFCEDAKLPPSTIQILSGLNQLTSLSLPGCKFPNDKAFEVLFDLPKLSYLNLKKTNCCSITLSNIKLQNKLIIIDI